MVPKMQTEGNKIEFYIWLFLKTSLFREDVNRIVVHSCEQSR